jgi:GNAT superfamily N-acetyltransferase
MSEYWQVATEEADYFSTFALLPSYQQHGIGTWCMQQADTIAREAGYRWLRFDAVASHPKLLHFYSRLGYAQRGILDLGRAQVMCYEKDLSQAGS